MQDIDKKILEGMERNLNSMLAAKHSLEAIDPHYSGLHTERQDEMVSRLERYIQELLPQIEYYRQKS